MGRFERAGKAIGRTLDRHILTVALIISGLGLAFATSLWGVAEDHSARLYLRLLAYTGLLITLAALIFSAIRQGSLQRQLSTVETEKEKLEELISGFGSDYFDIWAKRLQVLAEELAFDARDRISVYRFADDAFTMVGRFSVLPDLCKPGRSVYPSNQGIIGTAWQSGDGKCLVTDLPDPDADLDAYLDRSLAEWQMPNDVILAMTMKPRSVAAYALMNQQKSERNAILVFESKAADRFSGPSLEKRVNGSSGKEIVLLLEILRVREPSLEYARKKGF